MRRIALLLLAVVSAVALTGCSGADAERARQLLQQSDQALAGVKSFRFAGRLWMKGPDGEEITLVLTGGGNQADGGSMFLDMRAEGVPGFPSIGVVMRGPTLWMRAGGEWRKESVPAGQPTGVEQFDLTPYVKAVAVDDGPVIEGEPTAKITGVIDTAQLMQGMLGQLGGFPGTGGTALPELTESFGDTRVVLYVSETTHLPLRALIDLSVEAAGESVEMHLDFALSGFNEPVKIPKPAV